MTFDELQDYIYQLGEQWVDLGKWKQPDPFKAVAFMVTEAGEALSDAMSAEDAGFVRNNYEKTRNWVGVDEEVADTIIMALRYFAARGYSAEQAVLSKIERMDEKKHVQDH